MDNPNITLDEIERQKKAVDKYSMFQPEDITRLRLENGILALRCRRFRGALKRISSNLKEIAHLALGSDAMLSQVSDDITMFANVADQALEEQSEVASPITKLETGKYYWFRWKVNDQWRIGYVREYSGEQWMICETREVFPKKVSNIDMKEFDWIEVQEPE